MRSRRERCYPDDMSEPRPYTASPDELDAIDEALAGDAIPAEKLVAHYRAEAARLCREANSAESAEIRAALMEPAERLDELAVVLASR